MAIRVRRGNFSDFDPTKMVAGEPAAVLTGQPNSSGGGGIYISFVNGQATRLAEYEDMSDTEASVAESAQEAADSATAAAASALQAATSASSASTSATNASSSASTAQTAATSAATSAQNAATSAQNAATSESNAADSATSAAESASTAEDCVELLNVNLAPAYQASKSYKYGDYVIYTDNYLYRCTTAHTSSQYLDPQYWKKVKVSDSMQDLDDLISGYEVMSGSSAAMKTFAFVSGKKYVFHNFGAGTVTRIRLSGPQTRTIDLSLEPNRAVVVEMDAAYTSITVSFSGASSIAFYDYDSLLGSVESWLKDMYQRVPTYSDPNNDGNIVISLG